MAKQKVQLSAINPFVIDNIVKPCEEKQRGKDYVRWGADNDYPEYLWDLYCNVPTLQSVINGSADFIVGNDIVINSIPLKEQVNKNGDTIVDVIRKIAVDKMLFGGYALQVIRNMAGEVAEIYHLDFMKVRSNEKNDILYYSDDWSAWGCKYIPYPKFDPESLAPASIYYNKGYTTRSVYPIPVYGAATIACEIEKNISEFHLNNLNNGFMSSVIINFNNGNPTDDIKEEIERGINEKFSGHQNAGRILISYNDGTENATTVERLTGDDFDSKYESLREWSRTQIFTAFRAPSVLFGVNPDQTGFNEIEFNESFKLYNRTVILPIQKEIIDTFDKILGLKGSIIIYPFSLAPKGETNENQLS